MVLLYAKRQTVEFIIFTEEDNVIYFGVLPCMNSLTWTYSSGTVFVIQGQLCHTCNRCMIFYVYYMCKTNVLPMHLPHMYYICQYVVLHMWYTCVFEIVYSHKQNHKI